MATCKHLIALRDFPPEEVRELLARSRRIKLDPPQPALRGKSLGLLFFSPSLRTRTSFEVAMFQLGGQAVHLSAAGDFWELESVEGIVMDGSAPEHVKDAAAVMARYLDGIAIRSMGGAGLSFREDRRDTTLNVWAQHSEIPVFNMESVLWHPCQALADALTIDEVLPETRGRRLCLTWTNESGAQRMSVANSLLMAAAGLGMDLVIARPEGYGLDPEILAEVTARARAAGGDLRESDSMEDGFAGAQIVYARSWGSIKNYGQPTVEAAHRAKHRDWIVNRERMALTSDARFMHSMPVRRNVVVTDEVLDSPLSIVYEQAANRLPTQKAALEHLLQEPA